MKAFSIQPWKIRRKNISSVSGATTTAVNIAPRMMLSCGSSSSIVCRGCSDGQIRVSKNCTKYIGGASITKAPPPRQTSSNSRRDCTPKSRHVAPRSCKMATDTAHDASSAKLLLKIETARCFTVASWISIPGCNSKTRYARLWPPSIVSMTMTKIRTRSSIPQGTGWRGWIFRIGWPEYIRLNACHHSITEPARTPIIRAPSNALVTWAMRDVPLTTLQTIGGAIRWRETRTPPQIESSKLRPAKRR